MHLAVALASAVVTAWQPPAVGRTGLAPWSRATAMTSGHHHRRRPAPAFMNDNGGSAGGGGGGSG